MGLISIAWTAIQSRLSLIIPIVCLGIGGWLGYKIGHESGVLYKAQVVQAAQKQEVQVARQETQQAEITTQIGAKHEETLDNLRKFYSDKLRQSYPGGVLKVPEPPASVDEVPADSLPLAGQCAETTQQLVDLQEWIKQESSVQMPDQGL